MSLRFVRRLPYNIFFRHAWSIHPLTILEASDASWHFLTSHICTVIANNTHVRIWMQRVHDASSSSSSHVRRNVTFRIFLRYIASIHPLCSWYYSLHALSSSFSFDAIIHAQCPHLLHPSTCAYMYMCYFSTAFRIHVRTRWVSSAAGMYPSCTPHTASHRNHLSRLHISITMIFTQRDPCLSHCCPCMLWLCFSYLLHDWSTSLKEHHTRQPTNTILYASESHKYTRNQHTKSAAHVNMVRIHFLASCSGAIHAWSGHRIRFSLSLSLSLFSLWHFDGKNIFIICVWLHSCTRSHERMYSSCVAFVPLLRWPDTCPCLLWPL